MKEVKIIAFYFPVPGFPLATRENWTVGQAEFWLAEHGYRGYEYDRFYKIKGVFHMRFVKPRYAKVPRSQYKLLLVYSKHFKKYLYVAVR